MKIKMNFGTVKTVIIAVVFAGILAVLGLDIAMLAGAKGIVINSVAIPIVSLIAALLVGLACALILFNSYYKFKEDGMVIMLGFFFDNVAYGDVYLLKQDIEKNDLFIIVKDKSKSPVDTQVALKVNVSPQKTDAFIAELRKHIPDITVEMFTSPKKKDKGDKQ